MDIEVLGLDSLVGPTTKEPLEIPVLKTMQPETDKDGDLRKSKSQRSDEICCVSYKSMQNQQGSSLLRSNTNSMLQEHLKDEASSIFGKDCAFPYIRSTGYGGSMHESFNEARGPFTPYQWMELEHQALIYKYISTNAPVPSNLLVPIKRSLYLPAASSAYISLGSLGWGGFQLCYTGNSNDPEPGRCRRTDGKKWRCSRDAVPDQKYCERHINRGRHRSRKHVEGQNGHASIGTSNTKVVPVTSSVSTSVVTAAVRASEHIPLQQSLNNLSPTSMMDSTNAFINRDQASRDISVVSSTAFSISKRGIPVKDDQRSSEFGLVSSDSLLNPSHRSTYLRSQSESFIGFSGDFDSSDHHFHRQFMDDWPKNQSTRATISWPDKLNSDLTQLSMSLPLTTSNFSSSSSFPTQEKLALSPMRLSHEFDPIHMGLEPTNNITESIQKQANRVPISWGTSMGGPLAEVLSTSTANTSSCKSSTSLDLAAKGWNAGSYLGSSPTGVLQKSTFGSLSSSSSGSSQDMNAKT